MRKTSFCICEADQRLCFRYTDSTNPLVPKVEISSLSSVVVQPGLCRTRSKPRKPVFHNEAHFFHRLPPYQFPRFNKNE